MYRFPLSPFRPTLLLVPALLLGLFVYYLYPPESLAQTTTLVPSSYVTMAGGSGGEPVTTSIDLLDESGANPVAGKYVDFWAASAGVNYAGYRVYTLPSSISPSTISSMQLKINYQGPKWSKQQWTWQIYNWSTSAYVAVPNANNSTVSVNWDNWHLWTFPLTGTFANYVRPSDRQIRIQLLSNNHADDTYIDYEAVLVTVGGISVSLGPPTASLNGGGTQQFSATVTGSSNTAVSWSLLGSGTLSSSGLYTAPASISGQSTATVKATSQADNTKSASATVTLNPVAVSVTPLFATVPPVGTQQFTATVTGSGNTTVSWQVNAITGGNATLGTISSSGLYTAPGTVPNPATVTVSAVAQADSTKSAYATVTVSAVTGIPAPIHGVTVADDYDVRTAAYLNQVIPALTNLAVTPTVRFLFTLEVGSGAQGAVANTYLSALEQVKAATNVHTNAHPFVMGMPVDSSYMFCFSRADHSARWNDYVNTLNPYVDVWEVGNEINGNWLYNSGPNANVSGESCPSGWPGGVPTTTIQDVANKMTDAYTIVKAAGKAAALTLTFCPTDLPSPNDPFTWVDKYVTSSTLRNGMDYVLISYYPDSASCAYGLPKASDWVNWFNGIESRFPNARVGLGEWGYGTAKPPKALQTVLQEGYQVNPSASLTNPANWISGVFYWEFGITAVPYTGNNQLGTPTDWSDLNTDLQNQH